MSITNKLKTIALIGFATLGIVLPSAYYFCALRTLHALAEYDIYDLPFFTSLLLEHRLFMSIVFFLMFITVGSYFEGSVKRKNFKNQKLLDLSFLIFGVLLAFMIIMLLITLRLTQYTLSI